MQLAMHKMMWDGMMQYAPCVPYIEMLQFSAPLHVSIRDFGAGPGEAFTFLQQSGNKTLMVLRCCPEQWLRRDDQMSKAESFGSNRARILMSIN